MCENASVERFVLWRFLSVDKFLIDSQVIKRENQRGRLLTMTDAYYV